MRLRVLAVALFASAASAFAQTDSTPRTGPASGAYRLRAQLSLLRFMGYTESLPGVADFTSGNRTIPKDSALHHSVGVVDGSLDVFGTINGAVMAVDGNIRIHPGATINGDAIVVRGRIINQGGSVNGETRTLGTFATGTEREPSPPRTTMWALKLTLGWFAVLVIIGGGVMIFAEANLDGVVLALERSVTKSFGVGLLGQLVALPVLALLCIALALTILGVLLIPFAIVAYTIVVAGLVTLGFLAGARLSGAALVRAPAVNPRGVNLRAMFIGLIGYFALWALAAAF